MNKNYFKITLLLLIVVVFACEKENGKPEDNEITGKDTASLIIEIQNTSNCSDVVKIKAILLGYSEVELASSPLRNGGFKLTLPQTVDDKYLYEREWFAELTVSDPKAKIAFIQICGYSTAGAIVGYFDLIGGGTQTYSWGEYVYADRDFTVTGECIHYFENEVRTYNYNYSFKKGWNIRYGTFCYNSRVEDRTTEKPSNVNVKWEWRYNKKSAVIKEHRKSLSSDRKHSLTTYCRHKFVNIK